LDPAPTFLQEVAGFLLSRTAQEVRWWINNYRHIASVLRRVSKGSKTRHPVRLTPGSDF
jgi:hypothetical protein